MSDELELLTREEVLDGLFGGHTKAASTVLFAIESRTAYLVAQSRQAMERFLTEETAGERELEAAENDPLKDVKRMLMKLEPQGGSESTAKLSESLASGDFEGAQQALEKMKEELQEAAKDTDDPQARHPSGPGPLRPRIRVAADADRCSGRCRAAGQRGSAWAESACARPPRPP